MDRVGEIFPIDDDDDDDAPAVQATTLPLHWMVHRSLASSSYYYSSGLSLSSVPVVCCCNNFINTLYIHTYIPEDACLLLPIIVNGGAQLAMDGCSKT